MDPVIGASLINAGAGFAGSLADQIFKSGDVKRKERFLKWLQSRMGQDVMGQGEQDRIFSSLWRASQPQRNTMAEGIARRLNLDSGVAQGELANMNMSQEWGFRAQLAQLAAQMKAQRDNTLIGEMGATTRSF